MNHIGTREIATERLTLRRFEIEDAENMFYNWANDPEVTKYLTWPAHESVDTTETILKEWISKYDEKDFYQWAIELNDLEQPIGTISAIKTDERVESVEIGYCIGKRFWNNGYMTEALTAIIRFFINEVGAGRVWARHDTENPNSGKVMAAAAWIMRVLYAMQASTIRVYAMKWYMQRSEVLRLTRSLMRRLLSSRLLPQR